MSERICKETLKDAFRKLLTYSYYDKTDLILRQRVADFVLKISRKENEDKVFDKILYVAQGKDDTNLLKWLRQINLVYYPKKIINHRDESKNNLITNIPEDSAEVKRLLIKADIPVELLILDVAWIMEYLYKTDCELLDCCWGNRLELTSDKSNVNKGNALFKKYQNQYGSWWKTGLKKANEALKAGENVSIITFDISNCYHSIDFDFEEFLTDYERKHQGDIRKSPLTKAITSIYARYWTLVQSCGEEAFLGQNTSKSPLPLSLQSAHILANWYLKPLDDYITSKYDLLYYGRYVDDCMIVKRTKSTSADAYDSIGEEVNGLLSMREGRFYFDLSGAVEKGDAYSRLSAFELQKEKIYVYRFDCQLPPVSLMEFEADQKERSSEFRFLTDEADEGAVNLESVTLISALDVQEENGRRFNILEENKYKLAVYLAKLSSRLARFGKEYSHYDEVEKVYRYFHGNLLIKHFVLWERIMTVFVLADKKDYVEEFARKIHKQISLTKLSEGLFAYKQDKGLEILQDSLYRHLDESRTMALSLCSKDTKVKKLYLKTFMSRMHFNYLPMQEFCKGFIQAGVRLNAKFANYDESLFCYDWIPYYVKYYDVVMMLSLGKVYDPDVFDKAMHIYNRLNHISKGVKASDFCHHLTTDAGVSEFNPLFNKKIGEEKKVTVAVINLDLSNNEGETQINDFGTIKPERIIRMQAVLDKLAAIGNVSIFILPEMSLPFYELREFCLQSSKRSRAFVAGMEYYVSAGKVYNYTITCLPIELNGRKDVIPVIRLKNHYAPSEYETIKRCRKSVPQNNQCFQNLYHWRNHVFTTYYCYELTSIKERSFFYSQLDAIYCPVFNPDTYYFNNIAASMARDMHCFFILSNVSHFGDSRVTAPMKHDYMNLLRVKGGITNNNEAIVLTADLDIKRLRDFQAMDCEMQRKDNGCRDGQVFKYTPPDYDKVNLEKRRREKFILDHKDSL